MFFKIFCLSYSFRLGKAKIKFLWHILFDLKKGPRKEKILPDNFDEYFKPIILKIKNNIITKRNCKKYFKIFIKFFFLEN